MAWIESHQTLKSHPKTKRMARQLGVSVAAVIGHLHLFWWWSMDYAENGNLSRYDMEDIADAAEWEGDPQVFLDAMLNCGPGESAGFIEYRNGELFVHDWDEYMGRLIEKKEQNRERQSKFRTRRATKKQDVTHDTTTHHEDKNNDNEHVTRYSRVSNDATYQTNQTKPNQPNQTKYPLNPPEGEVEEKPLELPPSEKPEEAEPLPIPSRPPEKSPREGVPYNEMALAPMYECSKYVPNFAVDTPSDIRFLQELGQEYPQVNLLAEFRKARDWLISALPKKRPKKDLKAFLRNWVSNAVNKYGVGQPRVIGYETVTEFVPIPEGGGADAGTM